MVAGVGNGNASPPPRRCGVGLMLEQESYGKPVYVSEVVTGGPCARSGQISKGDELAYVEGVPIARLSGEELSSLIGGLEGTNVVLGLERIGDPSMGVPSRRFEVLVSRGVAAGPPAQPAPPRQQQQLPLHLSMSPPAQSPQPSHPHHFGESRSGSSANQQQALAASPDNGNKASPWRDDVVFPALMSLLKTLRSTEAPSDRDRPVIADDESQPHRVREGRMLNVLFEEIRQLKLQHGLAVKVVEAVKGSGGVHDPGVGDAVRLYDQYASSRSFLKASGISNLGSRASAQSPVSDEGGGRAAQQGSGEVRGSVQGGADPHHLHSTEQPAVYGPSASSTGGGSSTNNSNNTISPSANTQEPPAAPTRASYDDVPPTPTAPIPPARRTSRAPSPRLPDATPLGGGGATPMRGSVESSQLEALRLADEVAAEIRSSMEEASVGVSAKGERFKSEVTLEEARMMGLKIALQGRSNDELIKATASPRSHSGICTPKTTAHPLSLTSPPSTTHLATPPSPSGSPPGHSDRELSTYPPPHYEPPGTPKHRVVDPHQAPPIHQQLQQSQQPVARPPLHSLGPVVAPSRPSQIRAPSAPSSSASSQPHASAATANPSSWVSTTSPKVLQTSPPITAPQSPSASPLEAALAHQPQQQQPAANQQQPQPFPPPSQQQQQQQDASQNQQHQAGWSETIANGEEALEASVSPAQESPPQLTPVAIQGYNHQDPQNYHALDPDNQTLPQASQAGFQPPLSHSAALRIHTQQALGNDMRGSAPSPLQGEVAVTRLENLIQRSKKLASEATEVLMGGKASHEGIAGRPMEDHMVVVGEEATESKMMSPTHQIHQYHGGAETPGSGVRTIEQIRARHEQFRQMQQQSLSTAASSLRRSHDPSLTSGSHGLRRSMDTNIAQLSPSGSHPPGVVDAQSPRGYTPPSAPVAHTISTPTRGGWQQYNDDAPSHPTQSSHHTGALSFAGNNAAAPGRFSSAASRSGGVERFAPEQQHQPYTAAGTGVFAASPATSPEAKRRLMGGVGYYGGGSAFQATSQHSNVGVGGGAPNGHHFVDAGSDTSPYSSWTGSSTRPSAASQYAPSQQQQQQQQQQQHHQSRFGPSAGGVGGYGGVPQAPSSTSGYGRGPYTPQQQHQHYQQQQHQQSPQHLSHHAPPPHPVSVSSPRHEMDTQNSSSLFRPTNSSLPSLGGGGGFSPYTRSNRRPPAAPSSSSSSSGGVGGGNSEFQLLSVERLAASSQSAKPRVWGDTACWA